MSPDELAKLENRAVLLDVCNLINNLNRHNGRLIPFKTSQHEAFYDALRADHYSAIVPTMVAVFRAMGLDVHTRGEEQTGQLVDISYHYAGGAPFVLIGDTRVRLVFAIAPKDACAILCVVAQQTSKERALVKLLKLARQFSTT